MQVTLETPKASDLFAESDLGLQPTIPHCVAAANGSWCNLDTDDEEAGEEFDEEDFDDEEDDGYGDFDDTIDPFATDNDVADEEGEEGEDVDFDE